MNQFGHILELFWSGAVEFWLKHIFENFQKTFDKMKSNFDWNTIWTNHGIISIRCKWLLAKTQFGNFIYLFQEDAVSFRLRHYLEMSENFTRKIQLNLSSHKIGKDSEELRWNLIEFQLWNIWDKSWIKFNQMHLKFG